MLSAAKLRGWWRPIVFIIFVFAAVATPTGDPLTMTVLAVPICLLFFVALGVATMHDRQGQAPGRRGPGQPARRRPGLHARPRALRAALAGPGRWSG
ncbi:hypothetical protein GXW82_19750 [Streptacidiphilus sp. 4-A2]|nr:hypothetical protein [Streptacidiphilus sp. 4-A2]